MIAFADRKQFRHDNATVSVEKCLKTISGIHARKLGEYLATQIREKLNLLQSASVNFLATLLEPYFKNLGFFSENKCKKQLKY